MFGIGGRTIAEAQARMSYAEAVAWAAYRIKYGSLNIGLRLEIGFGQVLAMIANACGNDRATVFDFAPHLKRPERKTQTFDEMVAALTSVAPRK